MSCYSLYKFCYILIGSIVITTHFPGDGYNLYIHIFVDEVVEWQEMLKKEGQDHIPKLLLGNKCDEEYSRTETNLTAFQTADDYGMKYFEVSAKEDSQVELSFLSLVALVLRKKSLV